LNRQMSSVIAIYAAHLHTLFPDDPVLLGCHHKVEWSRDAAHQARHAMGQTTRDRVSEIAGQRVIELGLVLRLPLGVVGRVLAVARLLRGVTGSMGGAGVRAM